jgi:mannobiose 2-epimerase
VGIASIEFCEAVPDLRSQLFSNTALRMNRTALLALALVFTSRVWADVGASTIQQPTAADIRAYAASAENELRTDILPFWLDHARDLKRGGFYGLIDEDMRVHPDAPRGTLLTARVLWTFSAAYRRFHDPAYLTMAQWAEKDLLAHGWDAKFGGLFWTTAPDGTPVTTVKHVYDQSFGIYALSEYYRTTKDQAALDRAIAIYRLIESKARDHQHGGYFESFTRDWRRDDSLQRRILGGTGAKSQNTHIHLLEAYTNLYRAWPDPQFREDFRALLTLMLTRIIDPHSHHLVLYFNDDWTPVSEEISFGHDIELSWLVVEAASVLGDPTLLAQARATALQMADVTERQGLDTDGGVLNEAGPHGITDANKDWWPQAEAAVGFLNAYQISAEPRFFADSRRVWGFIQAKFVDRTNGDWWQSLTRDGHPRPHGAKVSTWKCPYHNSRSCLELLDRLDELARNGAVKATAR